MAEVLIAMSGGVDSSVAAFLAMEEGHRCIGATMRLYESSDTDSNPAAADAERTGRNFLPAGAQSLNAAQGGGNIGGKGDVCNGADAAAQRGGDDETVRHRLAGRRGDAAGKSAGCDLKIHLSPPIPPG